jgi:hypothetical protein
VIRRPRLVRVVFDGQSRMALPTYDGFLGYSWGRLLMAGRGLPGYMVAVSGQSWTNLAANFATRARPRIASAPGEKTIYVMCGGESDIIDTGDSAATVYADAGTIAGLARSAGADYIICTTMLPSVLFTPTQETVRLAANALYLADASDFFDASVDICVSGVLNTADKDVYLDGTHIYGPFPVEGFGRGVGTQRVAAVVAPYLDAAIDALT